MNLTTFLIYGQTVHLLLLKHQSLIDSRPVIKNHIKMNPKREKMFTSEFNTKFINLIQSSPAIWNHFDDGFGDREVKRDNWYKIGAQLFENWDEFEEHEKIDLG